MRRAFLLCAVLIGFAIVVSCGSDSSSPAAPSAPSYDGKWTGTTGQKLPVSFTVTGNTVTQFSLGQSFNFSGLDAGAVCTKTIEGAVNAAITGSSFKFTLSSGGMSTEVSGSFSAGAQVAGEYSAITLTNFGCGTYSFGGANYASPPRTFTAAKG